jgi:hypothetical protein
VKQTTKQFFATPAGKLTLAVIAMVLCWTILIVYLSTSSPGGTWFPTESDMTRVQEEIKKYNRDYETEQAALDVLEAQQDKYEDSLTTFWNADRDGEPETELRNLVNDAAQHAEANIQNLGSVRISTINSELSYADLDFTVVDEYSKVIRFFAEIEKCTPRLSWRRVELRVEPTRARAVTGPGNRPNATTVATATTTPTQMFRTTGQVRVVKYSPAGNAATASKTGTAAKAGTTAAKAGTTAAKASTTTTTTPAAATTTPAARQDDNAAQPAADPAAATGTPAQTEPAATATTNKEESEK